MRLALTITLCALALSSAARPQEKPTRPQPQITIDLKPLGAAPDLFSDQSDSKYQQRGIATIFWLGNDRLAAAFSTNRRWSNSEKPEPLHIRLLIFDRNGKQQNARDWNVSAEGIEAASTLQLAPGPDNSILAVHVATNPNPNVLNKIPDGDFIQVLNPDTTLRQNFYVPATSDWIPNIAAQPNLLLETFYTDKHTSITWWSGQPLRAGPRLDLPPGTETTTSGPGVAARAICQSSTHCSAIRVFTNPADGEVQPANPATPRANRSFWMYYNTSADLVPIPELFLSSTALLIEVVDANGKRVNWFVAHRGGTQTTLPDLPKDLQISSATGISADGQRFAVNAVKQTGICGGLDLWCKEHGEAIVIDLPASRIVFEQEISAFGGTSALSPDGQSLAIFDRNKLMLYKVQ